MFVVAYLQTNLTIGKFFFEEIRREKFDKILNLVKIILKNRIYVCIVCGLRIEIMIIIAIKKVKSQNHFPAG